MTHIPLHVSFAVVIIFLMRMHLRLSHLCMTVYCVLQTYVCNKLIFPNQKRGCFLWKERLRPLWLEVWYPVGIYCTCCSLYVKFLSGSKGLRPDLPSLFGRKFQFWFVYSYFDLLSLCNLNLSFLSLIQLKYVVLLDRVLQKQVPLCYQVWHAEQKTNFQYLDIFGLRKS